MSLRTRIATALLPAVLLSGPAASQAEAAERWRQHLNWPPRLTLDHVLVQASLYTSHFSSDPEHTNNQQLISIELHNPDRWFTGLARFENSFDQDSHYLYAGRKLPLWSGEKTRVRAKLTAGALHGYRGEYRDKIPFNRHEIAPAILPAVGVRWRRLEADVAVFGTAGAMLTGGFRF